MATVTIGGRSYEVEVRGETVVVDGHEYRSPKDWTSTPTDLERAMFVIKDAPIILICRSGDRSSKAQDRLQMASFTRVYSITEGVEGDTAKDGPKAGQRTVNGWKNAGLPWTYKLDKAKMYFPH